jgi:hypothetical protein
VCSEQAKLTASDNASYDEFGNSVSIDGDTAVIGAYYDDDNGANSGSAYILPLSLYLNTSELINVPAMGGIVLLALGLSMLGLGLLD